MTCRASRDGPDNLARFNMPLELGMAVGLRYLREVEKGAADRGHNWLALVPADFIHQRFLSDLAGYDASDHDGDPRTVIRRVAAWLSLQPDFTPPAPKAKVILDAYPTFCQLLDKSKEDSLGVLTWPVIIEHVETVVTRMD